MKGERVATDASTTTAPEARSLPREGQPADRLAIFGITGDLAKVMTFRSLYRLERRGLLDCPILGVAADDWTVDQLIARARESIVGTGEQLDEDVFRRFAARLSYVSGDFDDDATYERVADALGDAKLPVFYLEIPPFLFGRVVKGLADAGLTARPASSSRSRSATTSRPPGRSPPRCTATSTRRRSSGSTTTSGRWAPRRSSGCGSRTRCSSRSGAASTSIRPDHDGGGLRRRGPRSLLRPGRGAARRRRQPPHAGRLPVRDGGAGARRPADDQGRPARALPRGQGGRPGALRAGAVRGLPLDRRRRARLDHGDLRRAAAGDRELALVGRPVLHPHRQAPAGDPDGAAARLQAPAATRVPRLRRGRAEPARRQARSVDRDPARARGPPRGRSPA